MQDWLTFLLSHDRLQGLVVYGSPYAWHSLRALVPPTLPCGFTYGQMPIAQEIILESLFATGVGQNSDQLKNAIEFTT